MTYQPLNKNIRMRFKWIMCSVSYLIPIVFFYVSSPTSFGTCIIPLLILVSFVDVIGYKFNMNKFNAFGIEEFLVFSILDHYKLHLRMGRAFDTLYFVGGVGSSRV
jgi:hypothetical protein